MRPRQKEMRVKQVPPPVFFLFLGVDIMNNKRYDEWYFYDECDKFLKELNFVYKTYTNNIENIFKDPDVEANEYEQYLYQNLGEVSVYDEQSIPSEIQSMCYHRYILIKNIKYRYLATHINLIYQMFEQFLLSISKRQQKFISHDRIIKELKLENLTDCVEMMKKYDFDISLFDEYNKINELKFLYNVIKHGDGKSKRKLEKIRPDIFSKNDLDIYNNTIIDDTLNISKTDLISYINSINNILKKFPDKIVHEFSTLTLV